jgi:hypothetical protein
MAVEEIREVARLAVVRLEEGTVMGGGQVLWLRAQGLDVDDFRLNPLGGGTP